MKGHEANVGDLITERIRGAPHLNTLMVEYRPLAGSVLGELTANFEDMPARSHRAGAQRRAAVGPGPRCRHRPNRAS